jgi:AcrR family transcriptional regulator
VASRAVRDGAASEPAPRERRRYDSTLRREMAAETRRRIVTAGVELLHSSHIRDWDAITIRAVAERAGVNERTVYRHFTNERGLRDAVMGGLEDQAGIVLESMELRDVAPVAARIFEHVSSFPLPPRPDLDPTLTDASQRVHAALLGAVTAQADGWSAEAAAMTAAVLDVLWSVAAYERLVREWQLPPEQATQALIWVIGMVEDAVEAGRRPATRD